MKESNSSTEPIGQNLIKLISNLCFSVFAFSVLIFTIIAITYQPPDPWLESAPALTKLFTEIKSATFKNDNSVLKMGVDFSRALSSMLSPLGSTITKEVIEKEAAIENLTLPKLNCEDLEKVKCLDPQAMTAIEKFNLRVFKSIVFLDYQHPVNGSNQTNVMFHGGFETKRRNLGENIGILECSSSGKLHLQSEKRKEKKKKYKKKRTS